MFDLREEDFIKTILAFDYGEKRIGVAIKQSSQSEVVPLLTLSNDKNLINQILDLINLHNPNLIIVGRPRNLDGEATKQTLSAERFARSIEEIYNNKVELQDEALSTEEAEKRIPKQLKSRTRDYIDQYAACIILENYLKEK